MCSEFYQLWGKSSENFKMWRLLRFICKTLGYYFSLAAVSALSWKWYIQPAVKWPFCLSTYFHTTLFFPNLLADLAFVQWLIQEAGWWYSFTDALTSLESQNHLIVFLKHLSVSNRLTRAEHTAASKPAVLFGIGIISSNFIFLFMYSQGWFAGSYFSC